MSTAIIENYYQSFNQGKLDQMLELVADNVIHEVNESQTQNGKLLFKEFLNIMDEDYQEQVKNLVVFSSSTPDRFSAEFNIDGIYKKSQKGLPQAKNQKYFIRVGAFFEIQSGKITRITNYYNLKNWIQAVEG